MRDPFAPNSNSSMFRDAQVGLLLVAVLLGLFVYVAYYRITGQGRPLPAHVRMAPIAEAVWPNGPPATPSFETAQSSKPTRVIALSQPDQRLGTNPSRQMASSDATVRNTFASNPVVAKPIPSESTHPERLRTDRRVKPVDFQKAESQPKAATVPDGIMSGDEVDSRLGLKSGDKIDSSKIRRSTPPPFENLFGGNPKLRPPKIVVRPPSLPAQSQPLPAVEKLASNSFQPAQSAFEQPHKRLADFSVAKVEPPTALAEVKTDLTSPAAQKNSLRPEISSEIAKPRTIATKPSLRPEFNQAENSFQPIASVTQPTIVQPTIVQPTIVQPTIVQPKTPRPRSLQTKTEKASFGPQQDIAKSAVSVTSIASAKQSSSAESPSDFQSPTQKLASNNASPEFRASEDSPGTYISKQGDSFWSIATEQYGDGRLFDALYRWNEIRVESFDEIPADTDLEIPTKIELVRRWPELCPSDENPTQSQEFGDQKVADYDAMLTERLYTTLEGDTLFEIAAKKLGQASRYVDIMAKNDQRLPSDINHSVPLKPGLRLVLPD